MGDSVLKEERLQKLLEILAKKEFSTVEYLSQQLQVSMPTIRRDLTELANRNLIIRSHGGAIHLPAKDSTTPVDFRKSTNYRRKAAIAREAVKYLHNHTVIFIDASTTAAYLSDHLKGRQDLTIITNSLMTATHLKNLGVRAYCLGGEVIGSSAAVGGALAIEAASNFNIDVMFFSAYGVNDRGMIVDTSEPETQLRSYLLKNTATSIFLCDSSKFGRSAMYNVAPLSQVNYMITDGAVPSQFPPVKDGIILVE